MSLNKFFYKIFVLPYLMRDAAQEFQNDNFNQAIDIYLRVIRSYPDYYDAYLWAGAAYSAIEQDHKAVEFYQKAIEINHKGFDAYYNYSQLELKQNRYENSLHLIIKAIQFTPYNAESFSNLYYRKGLLEYYLFNYQDALESFNKSLAYQPENKYAENGRTIAAEGILSNFNTEN